MNLKLLAFALIATVSLFSSAQNIESVIDDETGAVNQLSIANDVRNMNWILSTDGFQYAWIGKQYGWGLGSFSINFRIPSCSLSSTIFFMLGSKSPIAIFSIILPANSSICCGTVPTMRRRLSFPICVKL